ncbi:myeloperoxidase-like isoform X2 [Dysidea avara]
MKVLCWLLLLLGTFGCGLAHRSCDIETDSATAAIGHPFFLTFNYDGPKEIVDYSFSKDGVTFDGDNTRLFPDMSRIYFTEVTEMDAGTYTLVVFSSKIFYNETVRLCVESPPESSDQSYGKISQSVKAAISKMISTETLLRKKRDVLIKSDDFETFIATANTSSIIRQRIHPLGEVAAAHSTARTKMENVLGKAQSSNTDGQLTEAEGNLMLEYAQCPARVVDCSKIATALVYRTIDGVCNNYHTGYQLRGASNTAFKRLLGTAYDDDISLPVGFSQQASGNPFTGPWPSARMVSRVIDTDQPIFSTQMTHLAMTWGQFVDHDLDLFGEFATSACEESCEFDQTFPFCYPIKVEPSDPVFGVNGPNKGKCLPLTRSVGTCVNPFQKARQQINQITHYLDGSNVYGSTKEVADSLRVFSGGLLKWSGSDPLKGDLPFDPHDPVPHFVAGDVRPAENTALAIMHTIWLRQHNRLVTELAKVNSCWDDEKLYQEGRKIVGAMMQVITYKEFLPLLFGSFGFKKFIGSYLGYRPSADASIPNSFATAAYRFGHSLVRPQFARLDNNNKPLSIGPLNLRDSFFSPTQYFLSGKTDPILRGLMQDTSREVDKFVTSVLTTQLFVLPNSNIGQDLIARNIQRSREHGTPSYRKFQQACYKKFGVPSPFQNSTTEQKLKAIYGNYGFLTGIDLFVGGLAEKRMPGAELGPTFACIIGKTFADLRNGDRFYWENPGVFTSAQRSCLGQVSLAKTICDNSDGITSIIPRALQLGQSQQSCSSLPSLNLAYWKTKCN